MSDEQQIFPCVICNQHHEQMLMLSCLHDPCINCASIHYMQDAPKNSLVKIRLNKFYSCSKCNQQTQLDSSSVVQLQKIFRTLKPNILQVRKNISQESKKYNYDRNPVKGKKQLSINNGKNSRTKLTQNPDSFQPYGYKNTSNYEADRYEPIYRNQKVSSHAHSNYSHSIKGTYQVGKKVLHSSTAIMCHQHPQDQLSYFCFSCNKPICPQCAIHGAHKEHQVQPIRRAIKQIKARLSQGNQKISTEIGHLMHKKQQGKKHLKQLSDLNKKDHEEIKAQFNNLKSLLVSKQKAFLQAMTETYQTNCEETKHYGQKMDQLIESYNSVRRNLDLTLKKDDITVMQEFNNREQQAHEILDRNAVLGNESRIKSTKQVDYRLFEDEVGQLSSILQSMRLTLRTGKDQY